MCIHNKFNRFSKKLDYIIKIIFRKNMMVQITKSIAISEHVLKIIPVSQLVELDGIMLLKYKLMYYGCATILGSDSHPFYSFAKNFRTENWRSISLETWCCSRSCIDGDGSDSGRPHAVFDIDSGSDESHPSLESFRGGGWDSEIASVE